MTLEHHPRRVEGQVSRPNWMRREFPSARDVALLLSAHSGDTYNVGIHFLFT